MAKETLSSISVPPYNGDVILDLNVGADAYITCQRKHFDPDCSLAQFQHRRICGRNAISLSHAIFAQDRPYCWMGKVLWCGSVCDLDTFPERSILVCAASSTCRTLNLSCPSVRGWWPESQHSRKGWHSARRGSASATMTAWPTDFLATGVCPFSM